MEANDNRRISAIASLALMGFAVAVDCIQVLVSPIPFIGSIISIFATIAFFTWFALLKVRFFEGRAAGKRLATMVMGAFAELLAGMLPFVNIFAFVTTFTTWAIIQQTHKEDRENAAKAAAALAKKQAEEAARAQAMQQQVQAANDNYQAQMQAANDNAEEERRAA